LQARWRARWKFQAQNNDSTPIAQIISMLFTLCQVWKDDLTKREKHELR